MIRLGLDEIASIVGGELRAAGDHPVQVTGPVSVDSRSVDPGGLFAAIAGEHVDGHDFVADALDHGAVAVLASRPVDAPCVVVPDVTIALGQLAHAVLDRIDPIVIGITGSQGKTSVKDLVAQILQDSGSTVAATGSFNNELGVPLTVLRADEQTAYLIVEMGARGLGHIARLCAIARPDIGVVLNVGNAHVGEFGSADVTAVAKREMVEALEPEGVAVLNADDPRTSAMVTRTAARVLTFGRGGTVALGPVELDAMGEPTFTLSHADQTITTHVPQLGAHHAMNAAAAAAVCLAAGLDLATIGERLARAAAVSPMRMARTQRADGVLIIDDTYNANPESVAAALRAAVSLRAGDRRVVAVLGEMRELGDESAEQHREIGRLAAELGVDLVVAVGPAAVDIADGAGPTAVRAADTDEAARVTSAWLRPGDVVLVKASRGARLERVSAVLGA
ncbi:MAG TPA: UDP-N-acetylmuramoyl-tripeptide--D-alanyl-D-alanine ligase [Aeromicrobium sp.]|nr:UDP-N-acetylmuramoyl-tripeptide--D-alanyl-D-alanine ligase [Aeromicrobium sp.]HKY57678.1 UDP-N-acetylmuramoyl-tripeptide--D-alanyl-D-alanine ligase [Aeromicrobium sp.]